MSDTEEHLERWRNAGLIDAAAVARIRAFEEREARAPAPGGDAGIERPTLVEVFVYLGLAIAGAGIVTLLGQNWEELASSARILVTVVFAVLALGAGFLLRALGVGPFQRGAGVAWLVATALTALASAVVADESGANEEGIALAGAIGGIAAALVLWAVSPSRLQVLGLGGALFFLAEALALQPETYESALAGAIMLAVAAGALALVEAGFLGPRDTARPVFAALAGAGALHLALPGGEAWALAVSFATGGALALLSVWRAAFVYLAAGVALFFVTVIILVFAHLEDRIGAPLALMLSGACIIAGVVIVVQARGMLARRRAAA